MEARIRRKWRGGGGTHSSLVHNTFIWPLVVVWLLLTGFVLLAPFRPTLGLCRTLSGQIESPLHFFGPNSSCLCVPIPIHIRQQQSRKIGWWNWNGRAGGKWRAFARTRNAFKKVVGGKLAKLKGEQKGPLGIPKGQWFTEGGVAFRKGIMKGEKPSRTDKRSIKGQKRSNGLEKDMAQWKGHQHRRTGRWTFLYGL
jgi:hypothetical protein